MDTLLQELIEFVKGASPVVWEMLIKQVYAETTAMLAWAVLLLIIAVALVGVAKKLLKMHKDDEYSGYDMGAWICVFFAPCVFLAGFGLLVSSMMRFYNPEFYAIRYIIEQLK